MDPPTDVTLNLLAPIAELRATRKELEGPTDALESRDIIG